MSLGVAIENILLVDSNSLEYFRMFVKKEVMMITKNIEILCKKHGITISGLEKRLGFGNSTISKWATSSPTLEKATAVSNFFGITLDELLSEDSSTNEEKEALQ